MKKCHVVLSETEKAYLDSLLVKGSLKVRKQKRVLGLLELNRGKTLVEVGQTLGVNYQTVHAWRESYQSEGLLFLDEKPRKGRPIRIDGGQRAKITALACSPAPEGRARWSLQLLADKAVELGYCEHLSRDYAGKILKKTN